MIGTFLVRPNPAAVLPRVTILAIPARGLPTANLTERNMHAGKKLKKALAGKGLVVTPGVYDMISARIADGLGFSALYMTGFGVSATLGLPDAGLASYTEMVERVQQICENTATPLICDGDTGFGGLLNVGAHGSRLRARRRGRNPDRGPGIPETL